MKTKFITILGKKFEFMLEWPDGLDDSYAPPENFECYPPCKESPNNPSARFIIVENRGGNLETAAHAACCKECLIRITGDFVNDEVDPLDCDYFVYDLERKARRTI